MTFNEAAQVAETLCRETRQPYVLFRSATNEGHYIPMRKERAGSLVYVLGMYVAQIEVLNQKA